MREKMASFITTERERFSTRHSNIFGSCFYQIARYYDFLQIIIARYETANEAFFLNLEAQHESFKQTGGGVMTQSQLQLMEKGVQLTAVLHLEIESFYLFAKILLDKAARSMEFYFGQSKGVSLDSHDKFSKQIQIYITQKKLSSFSDAFYQLMQRLKNDICDYRDYQIAHEKNPRNMLATMYSLDTKKSRIVNTKLHPKDTDKQIESKVVNEIATSIDLYLSMLLDFISQNRDKTILECASYSLVMTQSMSSPQ